MVGWEIVLPCALNIDILDIALTEWAAFVPLPLASIEYTEAELTDEAEAPNLFKNVMITAPAGLDALSLLVLLFGVLVPSEVPVSVINNSMCPYCILARWKATPVFPIPKRRTSAISFKCFRPIGQTAIL